jgi:uncharacterized protein YggU (UPF0235/DUF167 family)
MGKNVWRGVSDTPPIIFCLCYNITCMKIIVKVKTKSKVTKVERVTPPELITASVPEPVIYKVSVKEAPVSGQANQAVIRALAEYFDIAPARVCLITGQTSKQKLFEIL